MTGVLDGKVAFVTGAAMGIGRAVMTRFVSEGAAVAGFDPHPDLQLVAKELSYCGATTLALPGDVRSTDDVDDAVLAAERVLGGIDIVVNNAGVTRAAMQPPEVSHMEDDEWDAVHDINLKGTFRVTRAALPRLRRRGGGVVVCLSSIIGTQQGWGGRVHYASSKAGVEGFVRALAVEVARDGIRVVGVAPGLVETAQTLDPSSAGREALEAFAAAHVPLGFVAAPDDIAALVTFLASDDARYLHGVTVTADGGLGVRSVNEPPERGEGWEDTSHV